MSEQQGSSVQESLSALMDNEASELELHRTLREVTTNESLRKTWYRYHLIGSAIRRELPADFVDASAELRASISAALVGEPVPRRQRQWHQALGRVAIAASVAVVAIFGVQQYQASPAKSVSMAQGDSEQSESVRAGASGPQFQLPSGFEVPQATARTVSSEFYQGYARSGQIEARQKFSDPETDRQIQAYIRRMMSSQAERGYPQHVAMPVEPIYLEQGGQ